MREFTDTEKDLVKALIQNVSRKSGFRLGEVLLQVYPIEFIEKNKLDDPFYKETIKICHKVEENLESKLYEAFSLIIMLIEHRYIVAKEFINKDIIGKKNPLCYSLDNLHEERTYFNYYDVELWELLNSHYAITNALVDFAKDFKTPEQRRHNCTIKISIAAIFVSILIGIFSPFISKWISEKSDKESIELVISAIKEQKSISIDKFPDILPDTLNVKVTDTPEKQPINLNVTVKENQPTKIQ